MRNEHTNAVNCRHAFPLGEGWQFGRAIFGLPVSPEQRWSLGLGVKENSA
jgi:hypothetical protein